MDFLTTLALEDTGPVAEVPAIRSWACDGFMGDWDGLMGIFFVHWSQSTMNVCGI